MQPWHLSLLVFITHHSGQLTYWIISEPIQGAAMCVTPVAEPPGFEKVGFGHGQSRNLTQVIWPCFVQLAHTRHQSFRGWEYIPMSKCSWICLCNQCCFMFGFSTGGFL